MAGSGTSDRFNLRRHAANLTNNPSRPDRSMTGCEMIEVDASDIRIQKSPLTSSCPLSYSATSSKDQEQDGKNGHSYDISSENLEDRPSTFASRTISGSKNTLHSVLRFVRRSGRYGSHISYEYTSPGGFIDEERKFSGWRGGVLAGTISTCIVLLINTSFTIWAPSKSKSGLGIGTLYEGRCSTVRHADSWLHLAINFMGTILLGASNFTMQCISSPTRSEIDVAHAKGGYLDIRLPSLKNLKGWRRKMIFTLLVLSTVPLHFLWNSAVFTTTQNLDYNVFVVTPNFFNESTMDYSQNVSIYSQALTSTYDNGG